MSEHESGPPDKDAPVAGSDDAVQPSVPPEPRPPQSATEPQTAAGDEALPARKSVESRKAALASAIQKEVVQGGRIESQSDFQAVFVLGKPVNHILHLILTLLTCLLWGLVWLGMLIWGGENRVMVSIDEYGNVLRQQIK